MGQGRRTTRRNMTITVDEAVARWARIKAAKEDSSVSQIVGEMLKREMQRDDDYEAAMKRMFEMIKPVKFEKRGGRFPRREELYDRPKRWS